MIELKRQSHDGNITIYYCIYILNYESNSSLGNYKKGGHICGGTISYKYFYLY